MTKHVYDTLKREKSEQSDQSKKKAKQNDEEIFWCEAFGSGKRSKAAFIYEKDLGLRSTRVFSVTLS